MIPAFRHMGGKARLRNWLIDHFPRRGATYCEPFCGKANVFFAARGRLDFDHWVLSDVDTRFLAALLAINNKDLPLAVERSDFAAWRNRAVRGDPVALAIEPRITFAGKGYSAGFSGSSGTHVGYSGLAYRRAVTEAQKLLGRDEVVVIERNWLDTLNTLRSGDFAYIDPPYFGMSACYEDISHESLVARLNTAPFLWAVSGYSSPLYENNLSYAHRYTCERNSEIKSSNRRKKTPVTEVLWTCY